MNPKTAQQQVKQQQFFISVSCNTYAKLLNRHFNSAATRPASAWLILNDTYPTIGLLMKSLQQLIKMS